MACRCGKPGADTAEVGLVAAVGGQLDAQIALGHVKALRGREGRMIGPLMSSLSALFKVMNSPFKV
jgi:hypothetical protein